MVSARRWIGVSPVSGSSTTWPLLGADITSLQDAGDVGTDERSTRHGISCRLAAVLHRRAGGVDGVGDGPEVVDQLVDATAQPRE
ncbi:MAG: hypothetical protein LH645_05865 [Actinomycetia bacterium]|nr:hypothetical protein [Actinomycetes bacterium]